MHLKNHFTIAEPWIDNHSLKSRTERLQLTVPGKTENDQEQNLTEIPFLLECKCALFPVIYAHDRKHEW